MAGVTHHYLFKQLKPKISWPEASILDFGCGDGTMLELLNTVPFKSYLGTDINYHSIVRAKKKWLKNQRIKFLLSSPNKSISVKSKNYHLIIAIGVISYLSEKDIKQFIQQSAQGLKKDGLLVITCASDTFVYKLLNFYRLLLPHAYYQESWLIKLLKSAGFRHVTAEKRGILFTPLFSNCLAPIFDGLDQVLFSTFGKIGPIGAIARLFFRPIMRFEFSLPINFGYTLIIKAKK